MFIDKFRQMMRPPLKAADTESVPLCYHCGKKLRPIKGYTQKGTGLPYLSSSIDGGTRYVHASCAQRNYDERRRFTADQLETFVPRAQNFDDVTFSEDDMKKGPRLV